jgi:hypothetical protein
MVLLYMVSMVLPTNIKADLKANALAHLAPSSKKTMFERLAPGSRAHRRRGSPTSGDARPAWRSCCTYKITLK